MFSNIIEVVSVRKNPKFKETAINYFQSRWPRVASVMFEDCINNCIGAKNPLPQWYLLKSDEDIIGGAGLITNDFISRMDLYPWVCALYIDKNYRGNAYASRLLEKAKQDSAEAGFKSLYLASDHEGFYEKYGFKHIGRGYHPWGESSKIYEAILENDLKGIAFHTSSSSHINYVN